MPANHDKEIPGQARDDKGPSFADLIGEYYLINYCREVEGGGRNLDVLFEEGHHLGIVGAEGAFGLHLQGDALPDPHLVGDGAEK